MKVPDTYVLLAKKINLRANLQRETELLCQMITGYGNNTTAPNEQLVLIRRTLIMFFDNGERK